MKRLLVLQIVVLCLACDSKYEDYTGDVSDSFEDLLDIPSTRQSQMSKAGEETEEISKKVVKTGNIRFQSEKIEDDYKRIIEILSKYNGYIESEDQSKNTQRVDYTLTIRVSIESYDSLFKSLVGLTSRLDNKSSNIEDVTERFYDLKTRIKNKKALELRYVELLKRASDVKDILQIEKNLNEVRTQVERLQGQFNYLSKQISLSTIHLTFYELLPYSYASSKRKGFGARLLSSLDNGWQVFLSFLVWFASLWPFLLLITVGVYLFKIVKNRVKHK